MNHSDPLGLYRALGISPTATEEEIAAAFRRRAKETHPDTSGRESTEEFVQVSAAYDVLGDPARREKYDKSSWEPFKRDEEAKKDREQDRGYPGTSSKIRLDPTRCDFCGKVTAQPRYLVFTYFMALLFFSRSYSATGIFCKRCACQKGLVYSIITMILGSWSFPLGPLLSAVVILRNAYETWKVNIEDDRLTLRNAYAFESHGNSKLAYALAGITKKSRDVSISRASKLLMETIEGSGADYRSSGLVKAWWDSLLLGFAHVVIALILPVALGMYAYNDYKAQEVRSEYAHLRLTMAQAEARADPGLCRNPPRNGQAIGPQSPVLHGHVVSIKNISDYNMIVKLRDVQSGHVAAALFVASGQKAWAHPIPSGEYKVQYAAGRGFDETCSSFLEIHGINERNFYEKFRTFKLKNGDIFMGGRQLYVTNLHESVEYSHGYRGHTYVFHYITPSVEEFNRP